MTPPVESPLALRVRQARNLAGIKARELDRLAGITEGHTSLIESGVVGNVNAQTAHALSRALGISLDWLIAGEGKEPAARTVRAAVEAARTRGLKTG